VNRRFANSLGNILILFPIILSASVIILVCLFMLAGRYPPLTKAEAIEVAERSRPIVQAIYNYKADHAVLPKNLSDLVPAYLPASPDGSTYLYSGENLFIFVGRPHTQVYYEFQPGSEGWYAGGCVTLSAGQL
jgi:hypothetical protein